MLRRSASVPLLPASFSLRTSILFGAVARLPCFPSGAVFVFADNNREQGRYPFGGVLDTDQPRASTNL